MCFRFLPKAFCIITPEILTLSYSRANPACSSSGVDSLNTAILFLFCLAWQVSCFWCSMLCRIQYENVEAIYNPLMGLSICLSACNVSTWAKRIDLALRSCFAGILNRTWPHESNTPSLILSREQQGSNGSSLWGQKSMTIYSACIGSWNSPADQQCNCWTESVSCMQCTL